MNPIRLGVPCTLSARPLIYGVMRGGDPRIEITCHEQAVLADALAREQLDAALIPSIEYLRGVGYDYVEGPALVARPGRGGTVLVARRPLGGVERIAVSEFCRTPVAAVRIALARRHGVVPDLMVEKNFGGDWRERYDAILMSEDDALRCALEAPRPGETSHDVASMWEDVTGQPLVAALWAYNDPAVAAELGELLRESRNLGVQDLSRLADGIAQTSQFDGEFLYEHFSSAWAYDLSAREPLWTLEQQALRLDLLRHGRLSHATAS